MTEFSRDLLREKLVQISQSLADLKRNREIGSLEYFRANPDIYHAVCYRFITVIESLFDAGQIILSSQGLHATGEDSISTLLAREEMISEELAKRFSSMYGFRNRLVHAYGTLDDTKVTAYLADRLSDIEELFFVFQNIP